MKKIILLICLCMVAAPSIAKPKKVKNQPARLEQPDTLKMDSSGVSGYDYSMIRLLAEEDDTYLPLVERFEMRDTILTTDDFDLLYYGFAFRPGYKGTLDAVASPVNKLVKEGKYQDAWEQGLAYLKDNPVSLTTLMGLLNAGFALRLPEEDFIAYARRAGELLGVIARSGDGKSPETAFRVIAVADEYLFLQYVLHLERLQSQALIESESGPCDRMIMLDENDVESDPVYFNVSLPLGHMSRMFDQ